MVRDEGTLILEPELGSAVITADGQDLGLVKEVSGEFFKVDAPLAPDFWLNRAIILRVGGGQVVLEADYDALEHERVAEPPSADEVVGEGTGPHDEAPLPEDARGDSRFLGPGLRTQ